MRQSWLSKKVEFFRQTQGFLPNCQRYSMVTLGSISAQYYCNLSHWMLWSLTFGDHVRFHLQFLNWPCSQFPGPPRVKFFSPGWFISVFFLKIYPNQCHKNVGRSLPLKLTTFVDLWIYKRQCDQETGTYFLGTNPGHPSIPQCCRQSEWPFWSGIQTY